MATVNIRIGLDNADIKRGAQEAAQELKSALNGVLPVAQRVGSAFASVGQQLTLAVTLPLSGLGAAAIKAASDLDKSRAQLTALTGSAENANKKLAELRELARTAPGVTTQFATTLFVQFKALGTITEESIERITKSLGRLNAVFTLADPQTFARNLEQIFSGGFERDQIKEALAQVPIFEQLLEQAFGTKDGEKLRKLKDAGKLTMQTWIDGLQNTIDTDPRFSNVQQTIAAKFAALQGEVSLALAPLGEALLRNLLPIIERIVPKLVELADAFGRLDPGTQESIVKFGLLFAAIGPVITAFGSLALGISSVLGLLTGSGAAGGVGLIGGLTTTSTLLRGAAFGVAGLGLAFLALESDIDGPLGKLQSLLRLLPSNALRPGGRSSLFTPTPGLPAGPEGLIPPGPSRDRIRGDLFGVIPGVTGTRAAGGTGDAAIQAAKQRNEQLERLELDRIRQSNRLLRADGEERQRILTEQFDKGLITMRQYYDDRLAIQIQGIQAEITEIKKEREQLENRLSGTGLWQGMAATGTERLQIEGKLLEILTNQLLKVRELTTALRENFEEYKKRNALPQFDLDRARVEAVDPRLTPDNEFIRRAREAEAARLEQVNALNLAGVNIRREILAIENQMELGQITAVQAREQINALLRQERDAQIAILEIRKQSADLSELDRANIDMQIEQLRGVGVELTNMQRFAQGFNSEVESFGDAFARFGQNVSRAFGTFTGLFDNLKRSIRQFFSDLIGSGIQQTLGMIFSALSGGRGGGGGMGGRAGGGGGGTGGFLGNLLGGLLGGRGGGGGGRFTTPPFAGGSIPGVTGVMVGSLPVMPNIGGLGLPGGFPGLGGGIGAPGGFQTPGIAGGTIGGAAGSAGLAAALKGFGFGLKPGSAAGPLAAIAPLLGAGMGMQLGGQSRSGQILGAIGGLAFGAGVTAAPAFLGGTFLAPLFSNPITAVVGAALLIGSLLLGRSQQRRRDEEQSGVWLQAAIDQIMALKDLARKGQVDVTQARSIFDSQIINPFIANINTLKTKSVRESRLTNQVRDLRNLFESQVIPAVASGQRRNVVSSKLIPEFATGGLVLGSDRGFDSVLARVRPGEMVLTREQQQSIQRAAGHNVFAHAGVPNVAAGGFGVVGAQTSANMGRLTANSEPMSIDLNVNVGVTRQDAAEILAAAGTTNTGQRVIVSNVRRAQRSRKL